MSFNINGPLVFGIDISHHNKVTDFDAVAASEASFCWCKATEGKTYKDPKFKQYASALLERGVPTGAYHYARPGNNSAASEAAHFLKTVKGLELDLLPVLDFEEANPKVPRGAAAAAWIDDWLQIVEGETGKRPVLYTGPNVLQKIGVSNYTSPGTLVWMPRYPSSARQYMTPEDSVIQKGRKDPALWDRFRKPGLPVDVWQYSNKGSVPGISGNVDLNVTDPATFAAIKGGSGLPVGAMIAGAVLLAGGVYYYSRKG